MLARAAAPPACPRRLPPAIPTTRSDRHVLRPARHPARPRREGPAQPAIDFPRFTNSLRVWRVDSGRMGRHAAALPLLAALWVLDAVAWGTSITLPVAFAAGGFSQLGSVPRGAGPTCPRIDPFSLRRATGNAFGLPTRALLTARQSSSEPLRGGAPLEGDDNAVGPASAARMPASGTER
jgi:hypothetical protein